MLRTRSIRRFQRKLGGAWAGVGRDFVVVHPVARGIELGAAFDDYPRA